MRATTAVFVYLVLAACGPSGGGHGGGDDDGSGHPGSGSDDVPIVATLAGKVWAPRWAPGDVPPGQEIPIFGATIYVTDQKPPPIPQQVYCEPCIDTPQGSVASKHDGSFELPVTGTGHFWLVIKKGPFRLEQEIDIQPGATVLKPQDTTLPSKLDPDHGAWIPKVAIVKGDYDAIEDILAKIGFGTLAGNKLTTPDGEIQFYTWGGTTATSADYLIRNISELRKYHIVFFPCSTLVNSALVANQTYLKNIRQYVAEGGRIYVTDWSGEIADRAFPPQLELGGDGLEQIDSVGTYDPVALTGTLTTTGSSDGDFYDASDGKALDPDLGIWLGLQIGPSESNPVPMMYNPNAFEVHDNWNWIVKLSSVMKGSDDMGMPVYDDPKPWVSASDGAHGPHPVAVTYEPTGCGKVLYTTFQTSGANAMSSHAGLLAQERVLLFLIMEISACTQDPVIL
jgi:hypothetical protein